MRATLNVFLLLVGFALATVVAGWWTVPVVAALWALARPRARRPAVTAGVVAAAAWAALLLATGPITALGPQARLLGEVFGGSALIIIAVTLVFPAVLAASSASLVAALRPETEK